mmetsp:Transcript_49098/g.76571  ORF Transcript_49098/g.76571 Transcript_49098/m.76571 type:complete len:181 (+) Transcript_49098:198-740(+)
MTNAIKDSGGHGRLMCPQKRPPVVVESTEDEAARVALESLPTFQDTVAQGIRTTFDSGKTTNCASRNEEIASNCPAALQPVSAQDTVDLPWVDLAVGPAHMQTILHLACEELLRSRCGSEGDCCPQTTNCGCKPKETAPKGPARRSPQELIKAEVGSVRLKLAAFVEELEGLEAKPCCRG